jgi:hypothetical protein
MRTSDERCSRPATRTLTGADPAHDDRSPERHRFRAQPPRARSLVPASIGGPEIAVDEAIRHGLNAETVDLSRLAALLRRACGPSVVGAVVGRARLQDELTRHLGCSVPMAQSIVGTMIGRGLIRQEVHRDGWVHWVVTV